MVRPKQLAEAQAHERRRLVTAFVTGRPPEHTAESPSAARQVLAGLAVAVLVLVGAVVVRLVTSGGG